MNHTPQLRRRLTAAATATGTLAVTLALLAGIPLVLWQATGLPWPERVSSFDEFVQRLTQPVGDPLMIDLLAMLGWVCWGAFAHSVVRETVWYAVHLPQLLRDRHTHHEHVSALSAKGSLAALCIGTLVVALIGLWHPEPVSAQQSSNPGEAPPHTVATAPAQPIPAQQPAPSSETASARVTEGSPPPVRAGASAEAETAKDTEYMEHIEHTVIKGDTLWDIAQTHMGDGLTWPRIYALNRDRVQHDGARLTDPDVISPGWKLTVPVSRPAAPPQTPSKTSAEPAPEQPTPDRHKDVTDKQENGERTFEGADERNETMVRQADTQTGPAAISLGEASLIGITTAAGLLVARRYWYWHRHRRRDSVQETETPALSPLVDRAAQAAHAASRPRRPDDSQSLAPRRTPPQKPRIPGTVTIGVRQDTEVHLDELAAPGGCALLGPGAEGAARALLIGILTAAERRRPGAPRVTAVVPQDVADSLLPGLPARFTALTQSTDLAEAIRTIEQHLIAHARTRDEQDTAPTTTAQTNTSSTSENETDTLLLLATPDAAHTGQLQALADRSSPRKLVVVALGAELPGAASWHVAADGTTMTADAADQHPGPLRLFHVTNEAGRDVTEMLLNAHGQRPRAPHHPPAAASDTDGKDPATPAPPEPDEPPTRPYTAETSRPAQTKLVRLHVLGPVTLYARGHQDPVGTNLRGEVHEFLALLAAHPTGLLASDIADKLHLAPGNDQSALKNLRRAVRRALRAATGITAQEFILLHGELHKLHPELVETDLEDFSRILKDAFSTASGEESINDALTAARTALTHYRGPFAQGSDYLWADATREHLAIKATDAALRLARRIEEADLPAHELDAVLGLLEHLGGIHPDHEPLAQHTIRLYQAAGRHHAARHTYTRLTRSLTDLGLEPEPATQALIAPRTLSRQAR